MPLSKSRVARRHAASKRRVGKSSSASGGRRARLIDKSAPEKNRRSSVPEESSALLYKVVELSTVDELHLEQTVNENVQKGWSLDGVQFAMRESSKRPSMAFVFFTRRADASTPSIEYRRPEISETVAPRSVDDAYRRLQELASEGDES